MVLLFKQHLAQEGSSFMVTAHSVKNSNSGRVADNFIDL